MSHTDEAPAAPGAPAPAAVLQDLAEFRQARAHIYPSAESLKWFLRRHRQELIDAGALLRPTGKRLFAQPDAFDRVIVAVGQRLARKG